MRNESVPPITKSIPEISIEWLNMERLIVKESTYAKYTSDIRKHIIPALGHLQLGQINSSYINTFIYEKIINGRIDGNGPLSAKTVRDISTVLKSILKYAENEYDLHLSIHNTPLPKQQIHKLEILTVSEQKTLENYLLQDIKNLRKLGIMICLYTGLRIGEICALRWQDVDISHKSITINHTLQRVPALEESSRSKTRIVIDTPKSSSSQRIIPITDFTLELLGKMKANSSDKLFVLTNKEEFIEPRNYQYFFHLCLSQCKIRPVNFHTLRHTFASRCVDAGFDIKTLSEILGHSNTEITLKYYIHTSLDRKRKMMDLLSLIQNNQ